MADTIVENKKGKAEIWKYFGFAKVDNAVQTKSAVCKLCFVNLKHCGNTTNLTTHMKRHHPSIILPSPSTTTSTLATVTETSASVLQKRQSKLTNFAKLNRNAAPSQAITKAISNFIIMDLRPFSVVENEGFKQMVNVLAPGYTIPSRQYFSETLIPEIYKDTAVKVKKCLKESAYVCITTDAWTSRATRSYITITSAFIDSNWDLVNFVLQTRPMDESHTGENVADHLLEATDEWGIGRNFWLVTDNAANMEKAAEVGSLMRVGCYAHTINLAAQRALKVNTTSRILAQIRKIVGFFHRSTSGAALLQQMTKRLELPNHRLITDVPTRWNSAADMLERFLELQAAIAATLISKELRGRDGNLSVLTDEDIKLAEQILSCLSPLKSITTCLCSEKYPTASIILPLHHELLNNLMKPSELDCVTIRNMKNAVCTDLEKRYTREAVRASLIKCSILDPRFKLVPFLEEEEREKSFDNIMLEASIPPPASLIVKSEPVDTQSATDIRQEQFDDASLPQLPNLNVQPECVDMTRPSKRSKTGDSGLSSLLGEVYVVKVEPPKLTCVQVVAKEVQEYRQMPCLPLNQNPLEWWKSHSSELPCLSNLARKYLCISATSVPSERVFSTAGDIITAQRAALRPENLDMLVFLKKNLKHFKLKSCQC